MNPVLANENQVISNIGQYLTAFSIESVFQLFPLILAVALIIATILAFFLLILGGAQWISSAGDKEAISAAKNKIMAGLIGFLIVLAAWAITGILRKFFGFYPKEVPGG